MKCIKCAGEGKTSRLNELGSSTTCLGWGTYYDEAGKYHNHDPNRINTGYVCSNGHSFSILTKRKCPNCDYGSEDGAVKFYEDIDMRK